MAPRRIERKLFGRELTEHEQGVVLRLAIILVPVLVLGLVIPTGTALYLVDRDAEKRTAAVEAESRERDRAIQRSRAQITLEACQAQNRRHARTIIRLDALLNRAIKEEPERAEEIMASRTSTIFLIDALVPVQPCLKIVHDRFGFVPKGAR